MANPRSCLAEDQRGRTSCRDEEFEVEPLKIEPKKSCHFHVVVTIAQLEASIPKRGAASP